MTDVLKDQRFWVGFALGLVAFYVYTNHIKKGKGGN